MFTCYLLLFTANKYWKNTVPRRDNRVPKMYKDINGFEISMIYQISDKKLEFREEQSSRITKF